VVTLDFNKILVLVMVWKSGLKVPLQPLKVVGNEKIGGLGRSQILGYGSGPWQSRFIYFLNMQFLR
jgi:hypothetical protein